jgi:hypothetical protein
MTATTTQITRLTETFLAAEAAVAALRAAGVDSHGYQPHDLAAAARQAKADHRIALQSTIEECGLPMTNESMLAIQQQLKEAMGR